MSYYKQGIGQEQIRFIGQEEKPGPFAGLTGMLLMGLFLYGYILGIRR